MLGPVRQAMRALRLLAPSPVSPCCMKNLELTRRGISTSHTRKALPPFLFVISKPLAKVVSALVGRSVRVWWRKLPENRKISLGQIYRNHRKKVYGAGALTAGGLAVAYESHIQECPITRRRRFVALTPDQAKKIGHAEFQNILEGNQDKVVGEEHPVYNTVCRIADRILQSNKDLRQIYDKTWTLTVIHDPQENAFVLPSGNIFVFTGMIDICDNEDELGIVLSHEIAHVVLGHVEEKLTLTSFVQLVLLVPMAVLWAFLPSDGIALVTHWFMDCVVDVMVELPFSREMENEADKVGLFLAAKACYDVREAPAFWGKMKALSETPNLDRETEFSSTHPCHETREKSLLEMLESAIKFRNDCGCARLPVDRDPLTKVAALAAFINSRRKSVDISG